MVAAGCAALLALGVGLGVYFGTSDTGGSRSAQTPQTSRPPGTTQVTSAPKTAVLAQADLDYVVALVDGSYRVTTIFQDLNGATQIMSAMGVMSQLDTLVSLCDALVEEYAIASALKPTPLLSEVHEHYVGGMEHFRDGAQLLREGYVAGDYSLVQQANDERTAGFAEWSQATPLLNELGMKNLSFGGAGDIPAVAVPPDIQAEPDYIITIVDIRREFRRAVTRQLHYCRIATGFYRHTVPAPYEGIAQRTHLNQVDIMLLRAETVNPDQVVPGVNSGKFRLGPLPEFRKIRLGVCRRYYLFRFIT